MLNNSTGKRIDTDALTRIPLPAILADLGYSIQQTGPGRFQADSPTGGSPAGGSPNHAERLSISRLPDGKWLYRDQNHQNNKGNAINFMQAHGSAGFREAANALLPYLQPEKSAAASALLNDLDHRYQDAGRDELQRFQSDIPLNRFVEAHGWTLDKKESTRTWEKYRNSAGDAIVVNPDKNFYFHQQNKGKGGGVIEFTQAYISSSLGEARKYLRDYSGDQRPEWKLQMQQRSADVVKLPQIEDRKTEWKALSPLSPKSTHYLITQRGLEPDTLAAYGGSIRTDIHQTEPRAGCEPSAGRKGGELHNVAFAHVAIDQNNKPVISGWEKKGCSLHGPGKDKTFSGFHGNRGIAMFKHKDFDNPEARNRFSEVRNSVDMDINTREDIRFCQRMILCESSIDALSKAQIDGRHPEDIYVSIGGPPSAAAEKSLSVLIRNKEPMEVVLAFDNDDAGRGFAIHMERYLTNEKQKFSMPTFRICEEFPPRDVKDWNDMLKSKAPARNQDHAREATARESGIGIGG